MCTTWVRGLCLEQNSIRFWRTSCPQPVAWRKIPADTAWTPELECPSATHWYQYKYAQDDRFFLGPLTSIQWRWAHTAGAGGNTLAQQLQYTAPGFYKFFRLARRDQASDSEVYRSLRTQLTIAPSLFSPLILIVNPVWISCSNNLGDKILKSRYYPAECIWYLSFALVLMEFVYN